MICPKCGRPVEENAVICRGCDFILDTGFLGGDILDEEHQLRPGQGGVDPAVFNLADAVILGNIGDDSSSFETSDSGFHLKKDLQAARLYVSGRSQAVMSPDAVIGRIDSNEKVRLTPFEKHVLRFIDGRRPVETIRRQAGLDEAEVKTALANLADKGVVRVMGRALSDAADFDIDTAPGVANKKAPPRRMRGTLVGAVVVVGDAADQAIDDAFRTQVRAEAPRLDLDDADDIADDGGVFSSSDEAVPAADSIDFDNLDSFEGRGTAEVPPGAVPAPRPLTTSKNTVRPSVQRDAVNNARDAKKRITGPRVAVADVSDASDGFDDFGDPSNLATAVVEVPSISDDSLPAAVTNNRQPSGVFADPGLEAEPSGLSLSGLDDFDAPGIDDLADSRVEPRPILPPQALPLPPAPRARPPARAAPPAMPSLSDASNPNLASASLNEDEREAMSGGVWGDERGENRPGATGPVPGTNVGVRGELSTSLSDLLDVSDEPPAPTTPARRKGHEDSAEEPTAFRAPPPPMAPVLPRRADPPGPARPRPVADPPSTSRPLQDDKRDDVGWPDSSVRARPSGPSPAAGGGAADELYPDDASFEVATDGEKKLASSDVSTNELRRAAIPPPPVLAPAPRKAETAQPTAGGTAKKPATPPPPPPGPRPPPPPSLRPQTGARAAPPPPAAPRGPPPPPPLAQLGTRPPPPPPLPDEEEDEEDLTAPPSQESEREADDGTHDLPLSNGSSAEILDSALVIRPAAKPMAPGAKAALRPPAVGPMADMPGSNGEDDDFMVDPDATMNLPPRLKSQEGKARGPRPPDPPPDLSIISTAGEAAIPEQGAKPRRPPTEDMRRKARNLFEQAQKDHAIGRIGAARMNAKLATIYDPDNEEFRKVLDAWEEKPKPGGNSAASSSRPEYVVLYEQAQDLEDEGDIDGALELLQKGIRMAPNAAAFHNRIGVILAMRKREFDRAAAEIEKAISLEPDNPHYRNNLGKVMQKGSKRKDAAVNAR
ncbi:MAG: hypothetical protein Q8O67_28570 [Deltaproteobacteria bacterium]|nr:hypothetical protein [Deltaproteobacteria bacterium]